MYTRLELDVHLRADTPLPVLEILHIMCQHKHGSEKQAEVDLILLHNPELPNAPFNTWRAVWMFRCNGGLGDTITPLFVRDDDETYRLKLAFSVKNYERSINLFLEWISPYLVPYDEGTELGMYVYEEDTEKSLVVIKAGKLAIVSGGNY